MKKAACIVVLAAFAATAGAGVVDLRNLPNNFDQGTWGNPNTVLYAQSLLADDVNFAQFKFLAKTNNTPIDFDVIVTEARADGGGGLGLSPNFAKTLWTSPKGTLSSNTNVEFSYNINIPVTKGSTYFVVLNTFSYPSGGNGTVWATQFNAQTDPYLPGEFVYVNKSSQTKLTDFDTVNWSHRSPQKEDLAIYAAFTPEPASVMLVGLCLVAIRRR